jgi:hypothetical protein
MRAMYGPLIPVAGGGALVEAMRRAELQRLREGIIALSDEVPLERARPSTPDSFVQAEQAMEANIARHDKRDQLKAMKRDELRKMAGEAKIENYRKMTKAELIDALTARYVGIDDHEALS